LIVCSFADRNRSARTADDSSTNADVIPSAPLAQNPLLCVVLSVAQVILNSFLDASHGIIEFKNPC